MFIKLIEKGVNGFSDHTIYVNTDHIIRLTLWEPDPENPKDKYSTACATLVMSDITYDRDSTMFGKTIRTEDEGSIKRLKDFLNK